MTPEQFQQLQNTVAESIEKNVNGKIRALDFKIDTYIREDTEYKERSEKSSEEWRTQADDKLQLVSDIQGFSKIMFKVIGFIVGIGGAVAVIIKYLHK
tara:strand:+ start:159 stop:452 length:294 start_codon:yes stop_codon:yes gene_type:complete